MKICLISPPAPFALEPAQNPPLGLCCLSAYLKTKIPNIEVVGVDFATKKQYDYNKEEYLKSEIPRDCDIYGITGFSCQFKWMKQISRFIRGTCKQSSIVIGGPHASACPEETFTQCHGHIVKGEGEEALYNLITHRHEVIESLDDLPIPDRELFGLENYYRTLGGNPAVHITTLRGCPYTCRFCHKSSVGTHVRFRSVQNVMQEIDTIINKYGIKSFVIYDDIFTLNRDRVYYFCDEFKKRQISWRCWSRTNLINTELLLTMKMAGLTSITFGVESGDDRILKAINKGTTVEQNRNALLACKTAGVPVRCSLMFGNPTETLESVNNTINLIKECQPDEWNLAVLAPVPGSEFWEYPARYGIRFDKDWVRDNDYLVTNRFGKTGVGDIWIELSSMSKEEMRKNLQYMLEELDKVCPRRIIQDTIQTINKEQI